jgi:uncharacterized protein
LRLTKFVTIRIDELKVLVDSNVIISALLWPNSFPANALVLVIQEHKLYLCDQILNELKDVIKRKAPQALNALSKFIDDLDFIKVPEASLSSVTISDKKDQLILNAAIAADLDIIITGDKHFLQLEIDKPDIVNPSSFMRRYK